MALSELDKTYYLRNCPQFANLPVGVLAELARSTDECEYHTGDYIMKQGDAANELFLLWLGSVSVRKRDTEVAKMRPVALIGELEALAEGRGTWDASVVAVTAPVRGLSIGLCRFQRLCNQYQHLTRAFASSLSERVLQMQRTIAQERSKSEKDTRFGGTTREQGKRFLVEVDETQLMQLRPRKEELVQFYIATPSSDEIRVRKEGQRFYITVKVDKPVSEEISAPISEELYSMLREHMKGHEISKKRYKFKYEDLDWKLDIFDPNGRLAGLKIAEVVLPSKNMSIKFPPMLLKRIDITGNEAYRSRELATIGIPNSGVSGA